MAAVAVLTGLMLVACGDGPTRSVSAVCHVWDTDGLAVHNEFEQADNALQGSGGNGLAGLGTLLAAPHELGILMTKLADAAPSDIEPDFQALADSFNQESSDMGNALTHPISATVGGLLNGLENVGSYNRANQYLTEHCGIPTGAGTETTSP